jgi:hypothetical protein
VHTAGVGVEVEDEEDEEAAETSIGETRRLAVGLLGLSAPTSVGLEDTSVEMRGPGVFAGATVGRVVSEEDGGLAVLTAIGVTRRLAVEAEGVGFTEEVVDVVGVVVEGAGTGGGMDVGVGVCRSDAVGEEEGEAEDVSDVCLFSAATDLASFNKVNTEKWSAERKS